VAQAAVGPPGEPARMAFQPGVVGAALDGEVDRDLDAMRLRRRDQPVEGIEAAERGMERIMSALGGTDRIGAAGIVRPRLQRVVAPLAVAPPDRMDGRE